MRRLLLAALAAIVLLPPALGKEDRDPAPAMRGPIDDFWNQVKREWARKIPGLQSGPGQTAQWVSLVYGSEGEDEALADLLEREMRDWAKWQRRNWVRSEFWRKRYEDVDRDGFYGSHALRQNLVVVGTPASNPMVSEMTDGTPFRIDGDRVVIGDREYEGRSLVLAFLRPNPFADGRNYVLVLAATRDAALLDLGRMPLGSTDYVLFRGGHPVDLGFLDWSAPEDLGLSDRREVRPDHDGWWATAMGPVNVLFQPQEVPEEEAREFARGQAADLPSLAARFGLQEVPPIDVFLYRTADSKLRQTGEPGPFDIDLPGGAIHRVHRPDLDGATWPEAMLLAWDAWGPTDLRGLLLGIGLLADGKMEGQPLDLWAARLAAADRLPPMEDLIVPGPPWRDGEAERALQALALGSFLADVQRAYGRPSLERFVREARARDFRARFREIFGLSIGRAERAWRDRLPPPEAAPDADPTPVAADPSRAASLLEEGRHLFQDRDDDEAATRLAEALALDGSLAEAHLLLARLAFRHGRDDEALAEATTALRLAPDDPEIASWARATRGRAHAVRGEVQSARLELTDPALAEGPDGPRLLADLWLENLGLSPNRTAASAYLAEQAEIDLLSFDWDAAERRALQILAADPGDADAHHLLARIRLEKFSYWYDFISLYNELFPSSTPSNPLQYYYLVQSSHRESLKGEYLASGALSTFDLDRSTSRGLEPEWVPDQLYPTMREPSAMSGASREVLRGRAFLLAGDYDRAAAHLRAALQLTIPVSDARAWVLNLLAQAEIHLGEVVSAQAHLDEAQRIARNKSLVAEIEATRSALAP